MKRLPVIAALALALTGCGLHPLYSGGGSGAVATSLTKVEVGPIEGKAGWLMTNALKDRFQASGTPLYRLEIKLDDKIIGLGVRRDDSVSRERRTLRARYQLVDLSKGTVLLDATAGSDAGIDVVNSEYADHRGGEYRARAAVRHRRRPDRRTRRALRAADRSAGAMTRP